MTSSSAVVNMEICLKAHTSLFNKCYRLLLLTLQGESASAAGSSSEAGVEGQMSFCIMGSMGSFGTHVDNKREFTYSSFLC
jgi:hypothetical protein